MNEKIGVKKLGEELKMKGLEDSTAYLFIQGHTLFENVVLMILKPLCRMLQKEHEEKIKTFLGHNKQEMVKNLNQYKNQMGKIENILTHHTAFKTCFLYKKIEDDITLFLESIQK